MISRHFFIAVACLLNVLLSGFSFGQNINPSESMKNAYWIGPYESGIAQISAGGYFGLIDSSGKVICAPKYDAIGSFIGGNAIVTLNDKQGVIHSSGREICPPEYDQIRLFEGCSLLLVRNQSNWGVLTSAGDKITDIIYTKLIGASADHAVLCKDGLYSIVSSGNTLVLPAFGGVPDDIKGGLIRFSDNKKYGLLNTAGELIVAATYEGIVLSDTGKPVFLKDRKYGILDVNGSVLVENIYDFIKPFDAGFKAGIVGEPLHCTDERSMVDLPTEKWGLLDRIGNILVPCMYDQIGDFSGGYATVNLKKSCNESLWGAIDSGGKIVIPVIYTYVGDFSEGVFFVNKNGKSGYLDKNGAIEIPFEDYLANQFSQGYAIVSKRGKLGIMDRQGKITIRPEYEDIRQVYPGSFIASNNNETFLIVLSGHKPIKKKYDAIVVLDHELLKVQNGDQFGIVDVRTAEEVLPIMYTEIRLEANKSVFVLKQEKTPEMEQNALYDKTYYWGLADLAGNILLKSVYEQIRSFNEGLAPICGTYRCGFTNKKGELVVQLAYEEVTPFQNGIAGVRNGNQWGGIDQTGTVIIPITNDKITYQKLEKDYRVK